MPIELSIVTGTYNRREYLEQMIVSARYSLPTGIEYEIVVVDGGSSDGTLEWLKAQPDVVLIEQGQLYGAIYAFNTGAHAAHGRYVLLANDDITFVGKSIARVLVYMHDHPECGIGAFYQDRDRRPMHVNTMGGFDADGNQTLLNYGQVCIVPRDLGDALEWWACGNARTYGGDNCLSARCWEAGYSVDAVEGANIHDHTIDDLLRLTNNPPEKMAKTGVLHPDSAEYYRLFPKGPRIGRTPLIGEYNHRRPIRIVYAPIYEPGHPVQKAQKRGLKRALQRVGQVYEVDYVAGENLIAAVADWRPHLLLTQFHDGTRYSDAEIRSLRYSSAYWVNWNGDVYDNSNDEAYLNLLQHVDYHLVVNDTAAEHFREQHINARYWQIGFEPDGVGVEPDEHTPHFDVLFMANCYSKAREQLGQFLKTLPYKVGLFGSGWKGQQDGITLYDFERGCQLYQAAKVAIGDAGWNNARGFVSNRLFQAMAAGGALYLQEQFDGLDLLGLENGKHLVMWSGFDDLRMKIVRYIDERPTEREQISNRGQREMLINHSFEARVRQLFAWLQGDGPQYANPDYANFHAPQGQAAIHA